MGIRASNGGHAVQLREQHDEAIQVLYHEAMVADRGWSYPRPSFDAFQAVFDKSIPKWGYVTVADILTWDTAEFFENRAAEHSAKAEMDKAYCDAAIAHHLRTTRTANG